MRALNMRKTFAVEDILKLIQENDLHDLDTFLVLNGGTGVGKTTAIMTRVKEELELKEHQKFSMLVVESRSATRDQLETEYVDEIEHFNGIDVCQRLSFMHQIEIDQVDRYDWVIIDECHGLFSDASFAEDAEYIARWIKEKRCNSRIIFITANDEYFDELSKQYFPANYNFIYLFPDFTQYVSKTYVKEIQFIKTNKDEEAIRALHKKIAGQKGIIFSRSANDIKGLYCYLVEQGEKPGIIVSQNCETSGELSTYQQSHFIDYVNEISDGETNFSMADLCVLIDKDRKARGLEGIREALIQQHMPEDITVLLATDTIQEGISIKSQIDYIIILGFTEVEVRQKLGRFRGILSKLFIIFNPAKQYNKEEGRRRTFEFLKNADKITRAEFYGAQKAKKFGIIYLKKRTKDGIDFYEINEPAYLDVCRNCEKASLLMANPQEEIQNQYGMYLKEGKVKLLTYQEDIKYEEEKERIYEIASQWEGVPLKGTIQEQLVQSFLNYNIRATNQKRVDTFKKCLTVLTSVGIEIKEKQASKKDLEQWPQLKKVREKYKFISKIPPTSQ